MTAEKISSLDERVTEVLESQGQEHSEKAFWSERSFKGNICFH